jgi:hypothetical protein
VSEYIDWIVHKMGVDTKREVVFCKGGFGEWWQNLPTEKSAKKNA